MRLHVEDQRPEVLPYMESLAAELRARTWHGRPLRVEIDMREMRGGDRMWDWVKKGVPVRVEVGGREVQAGTVSVGKRTDAARERQTVPRTQLVAEIESVLDGIQATMFERARAYRSAHTRVVESRDEFFEFFADKEEIHGGFAYSPWCGDARRRSTNFS